MQRSFSAYLPSLKVRS